MDHLPIRNVGDLIKILDEARREGLKFVSEDTTTLQTDDHDCYPKFIVLHLSKKSSDWILLKLIERKINWFSVDMRSCSINFAHEPNVQIKYRLRHFGYLQKISDVLNDYGIKNHVEVNWR